MKLIPDPIARDCRVGKPAYHHSGSRQQSSILYLVIHDPEAYIADAGKSTAEAVSNYFMLPQSGGSANLTVDDFRCFRNLADGVIPWGAPPLNTHGWHIEICGLARWKRATWLLHDLTLRRAAYKIALRAHWYHIPVRELSVAGLKADYFESVDSAGGGVGHPGPMRGGLVTHRTVTAAYHMSDHTDPGDGFPMAKLLGLVKGYVAKMEAAKL